MEFTSIVTCGRHRRPPLPHLEVAFRCFQTVFPLLLIRVVPVEIGELFACLFGYHKVDSDCWLVTLWGKAKQPRIHSAIVRAKCSTRLPDPGEHPLLRPDRTHIYGPLLYPHQQRVWKHCNCLSYTSLFQYICICVHWFSQSIKVVAYGRFAS
jgi:hypothetical protein